MSDNVWALVHAEREALGADLDGLGPADWERASLCPGWRVRDVVAHLTDVARTTRLQFVVTMARARFDFDRQNADGVRRELGGSPEETRHRYRATTALRCTPPAPLDTRLVEAVVHGEDVRQPLGLTHAYDPVAVRRALALQARTRVSFGGGRERLAGLAVRASDVDWSDGDGPAVEGPALALLMTASGRPGYLDRLDGAGVARLAEQGGLG